MTVLCIVQFKLDHWHDSYSHDDKHEFLAHIPVWPRGEVGCRADVCLQPGALSHTDVSASSEDPHQCEA